jgi:hypothetical protein
MELSSNLVERNALSRVQQGVGLMAEMAAANYWAKQGETKGQQKMIIILARKN